MRSYVLTSAQSHVTTVLAAITLVLLFSHGGLIAFADEC